MGLFPQRRRPQQARDELWERLRALQTDLEQLRARQATLETAWGDTLDQVRRSTQRLERAQERSERRDRGGGAPPSQPDADNGAGGPASGLAGTFAEKFRRLREAQRGGG